ncbi:LOW QUALITY PROTEIN: histone-lysine N-methyltransferase 2B-like [Chamaea fasciata]|uniref:LOW QUALITY PROTEIN: histone-lysine N-methyltransferase 2B-like n=3 Tax=Passeriformes TaxID=9126 RepID=UPI00336A3326
MGGAFPGFDLRDPKIWEPPETPPTPNGAPPLPVEPPSSDHTYARWRQEPDTPPAGEEGAEPAVPKAAGGGGADERQCTLCLQSGDAPAQDEGRLLYMGQNEWTHVNCALWSAEVFEEGDGTLRNVHAAVARGRQMRCEHCGRPGATVGCCLAACAANYHFMCARRCRAAFLRDKRVFCQRHGRLLAGDELVRDGGFRVLRRVLVDFGGISLKRKFLGGLEPEAVNVMIGSIRIDRLGALTELSEREGRLFPVGYQCWRLYWSTRDARRRCWYRCRILEQPPGAPGGGAGTPPGPPPEHNRTIAHGSPGSSPGPAPPSPGGGGGEEGGAAAPPGVPKGRPKGPLPPPGVSPPPPAPPGELLPAPPPTRPGRARAASHPHRGGPRGVPKAAVAPARGAVPGRCHPPRPPGPPAPPAGASGADVTDGTQRRRATRPGQVDAAPEAVVPRRDDVTQRGGGTAGVAARKSLVGGAKPRPPSPRGDTSEDDDEAAAGAATPRGRYFGYARTVVASAPGLSPPSPRPRIQQLDGADDGARGTPGTPGTPGTTGPPPPEGLPPDIVDFVLRGVTGDGDAAANGDGDGGAWRGQRLGDIGQCHRLGDVDGSHHLGDIDGNHRLGDIGQCHRLGDSGQCHRLGDIDGNHRLGDIDGSHRLRDIDGNHRLGDIGQCHRLGDIDGNHRLGDIGQCHRLGDIDGSHRLGDIRQGQGLGDIDGSHQLGDIDGSHQLGDIGQSHRLGDINQRHQLGDIDGSHQFGDIRQGHGLGDINQSHHLGDIGQSHHLGDIDGSHHLGDIDRSHHRLGDIAQGHQLGNIQGHRRRLGDIGQGHRLGDVIQGHRRLGDIGQGHRQLGDISQGHHRRRHLGDISRGHHPGDVSQGHAPSGAGATNGHGDALGTPWGRAKRPGEGTGPGTKRPRLELDTGDGGLSQFMSPVAVPSPQAEGGAGGADERQLRVPRPVTSPRSPPWATCAGGSSEDEDEPLPQGGAGGGASSPGHTPSPGHAPGHAHLRFEISSEDGLRVTAPSLEGAWRAVLERVQEARANAHLRHLSFAGMSGLRLLGIHHDAVVFLLEQLPGAGACSRYRFRYHPPRREPPLGPPPRNPSGCARAELYLRKCTFDMFSFLASQHRALPQGPPPREDEEDEVQLKPTRRATSLELPMAMRFRHLKRTAKEAVGVYRSAIHGRGLFCKRNIEAGEMVIEYSGIVVRSVLTDKREKFYDSKGIGCYMFRIDEAEVVDATMHGSAARFINHSCEPNCYSRVIHVEGHKRIVIFALRRILRGEELTYDYKFPIEEPAAKLPCNCGARRCRRFLN